MNKSNTILALAMSCSPMPALLRAEEITVAVPTPPKTRLEAMETQTGIILVKGTAMVGSLTIGNTVVTVRCKEMKDVTRNQRALGLSVHFKENEREEESIYIDSDEIDALLNAIDYLSKADHTVTSLPGFDATFKTRGELRIDAFSRRGPGTIEAAVGGKGGKTGSVMSMSDLARFRVLLDQGN